MGRITAVAVAALIGCLGLGSRSEAASILEAVKARGEVACGVTTGVAGFSLPDEKGVWRGFDVDFCRAVAAAVLGEKAKVRYVPLNARERFAALQNGSVDMLSRLTTWMFSRDVGLGVTFVGVDFFDGQGFLVRKSLNVTHVHDLDGATVCVTQGTTAETQLNDYFRAQGLHYNAVTFQQNEETARAYDSGRCDALTTDRSATAGYRLSMQHPNEHVVLDEVISSEPLALSVKAGDQQWADIVRWTLNALIAAEDLGVTKANAADMRNGKDSDVRRLLGSEGNFGELLGLSPDWALNAIRATGNYGEIYDTNVGPGTPIGLERGRNALARNGGLLFSPPFR
jgi:general L-amino acid transport system substrate-binding protein